MPVVLYGIVRAGHPLPDPAQGANAALGIGHPRAPLRLVRSGPLAAVVSATDDIGELGEQEAVRHLEILQRLLADGPVLPVRLGTVAPDDGAVRAEVLDPVRDSLPERLDAIDGLVELHLDVEEAEQTELAEAVAGTSLAHAPPPADLDGRIELGQRIAELVTARRTEQAEEILDELRPLARADRPRRHHGGPEDPALSWAFLVPADALDDFDAAVDRIRATHPSLTVEYVGPLPAVDFVEFPARVLTDPHDADPGGDSFSGSADRSSGDSFGDSFGSSFGEAPGGTSGDSFDGSGRWGWGRTADRSATGRRGGNLGQRKEF
ncbi:GvpL/GvpF family gas vesicle protein [Parafrankia elaeagni]|uniref:GvpL/GvpF family gas vesicle protein n=1 Tax=Parafrankia elaeagni TaxID=222534 RepID=UPI0003791BE1|nr:GvpL/GvpF family gas vesicle protein [Parafrankia elaeagni]